MQLTTYEFPTLPLLRSRQPLEVARRVVPALCVSSITPRPFRRYSAVGTVAGASFCVFTASRRSLRGEQLFVVRGVQHAATSARCLKTDISKVSFFHEADKEQWRQLEHALEDAVRRGEDGSIKSIGILTTLIADVRSLAGYPVKMKAFVKAAERVTEVGICDVPRLRLVVAWAARQALRLPDLFPQGLPMLEMRKESRILLTRRQCAALLAASLFGVIPGYHTQSRGQKHLLPEFDLSYVLNERVEKVLCILSYFHSAASMSDAALDEVVSFSRRVTDETQVDDKFWRSLDRPLSPALVVNELIENAKGKLQADFANRCLGGGALYSGQVQEEIRFLICPECLVGMLFCETMLDNEALFIVGVRQYSMYAGYGNGFRFARPCAEDQSLVADSLGRRGPHLVAFDALQYPGDWQYAEGGILRELVKVYTACLGDPAGSEEVVHVNGFATGNWGCGVFGGDPQLKALIQWLAASAAGRELYYTTFGDERMEAFQSVIDALSKRNLRCADLYKLLQGHSSEDVFRRVLEDVRDIGS